MFLLSSFYRKDTAYICQRVTSCRGVYDQFQEGRIHNGALVQLNSRETDQLAAQERTQEEDSKMFQTQLCISIQN